MYRIFIVIFLLISSILLSSNAYSTLYNLNIVNIDIPTGGKYGTVGHTVTKNNGFIVHTYKSSNKRFELPYEIFIISIVIYDYLPKTLDYKKELLQAAYGYINAQGCKLDSYRYNSLDGHILLESEYYQPSLDMSNIVEFVGYRNSLISIEYKVSGKKILNYSPFYNILNSIMFK